jgi:hypothetical protein
MILACVSQMMRSQHVPIAEGGAVVDAAWKPVDLEDRVLIGR